MRCGLEVWKDASNAIRQFLTVVDQPVTARRSYSPRQQ